MRKSIIGNIVTLAGLCLAPFVASAATLPSGYTELEYIYTGSSNKAYINTGVPSIDDVYYELDSMPISVGTRGNYSTYDMLGSCKSTTASSGKERCRLMHCNLYWIQPQMGDAISHANYSPTNNVRFKFAVRVGKRGKMPNYWLQPSWYWLDGKQIWERSGTTTSTSMPSGGYSRPLYLFALNVNGTAANHCIARLYSLKIYGTYTDNPTLLYDIVPCKNSSGTVGVYDLVSGEFQSSANSASFLAGPTVEPTCTHVPVTNGTYVAASCLKTGYQPQVTCSKCGGEIVAAATIPALGHSWGDWVITKAATATTDGEKKHTCTRSGCGVTETAVIPATGVPAGTYSLNVTSGNWNSASTWTGVTDGTYPHLEKDGAVFPASLASAATVNLNGTSYTIAAITNNAANGVTLKNGTINTSGAIVNNVAGTLAFEDATVGGSGQIISYVAGSTLKFVGDNDITARQIRMRYDSTYAFEDGTTDLGTNRWSLASYANNLTFTFDNARMVTAGTASTAMKFIISMKLGANNASSGAVMAFSGSFAPASGSTLAVDATAMAAGTYTLISSTSFTDPAGFAKSASVTVASGMTATLAVASNALKLTITGSTPTPSANSWTTEPSISPISFEEGTTVTLSNGVSKYGTPVANYTAAQIAELAAGSYNYTVTVAGTSEYTGLTNKTEFTVTKKVEPTVVTGIYKWNATSGNWASAANWTGVTSGTWPNLDTDCAYFPSTLTADATVDLGGGNFNIACFTNVSANVVTVKNGTITMPSSKRSCVVNSTVFENVTISGGYRMYAKFNQTISFVGNCSLVDGFYFRCADTQTKMSLKDGVTEMESAMTASAPFSIATDNARLVACDYTSAYALALTMKLGANNVSGGDAVLAFSGALNIASGSTLAVDATGVKAGSYKLISAATLTDSASLVDSAVVTVADGSTAKLALASNVLTLTITGATPTPSANSWTTAPSISPISFEEGTTVTLSKGVSKYGTPVANYTAAQIANLAEGSYSYDVTVAGCDDYTGLTNKIAFTVTKKVTPTEVGGLYSWNAASGNWASAANWTGVTSGTYPNLAKDGAIFLASLASAATVDLGGASYSITAVTNYSSNGVTLRNGTLTTTGYIDSRAGTIGFENMTIKGDGTSATYIRTYVDGATIAFAGNNTLQDRQIRITKNKTTLSFTDGVTTSDTRWNFAVAYYGYVLNVNVDNARFTATEINPTAQNASASPFALLMNIKLGANNVAGGDAVIKVDGIFNAYTGSSLTIDATKVGAGTYKIISAGTITDSADLAKNATVTVADGYTASLALASNVLTLTIEGGTPEPEKNSWTSVPTLSPTTFVKGTVPSATVGVAEYGTPVANYTAAQMSELDAGKYVYRVSVAPSTSYEGLTNEISFTVTAPSFGSYTWNGTTGNWASSANWTGVEGGAYPHCEDDEATFAKAADVDLKGLEYTLGNLVFNSASGVALRNGKITTDTEIRNSQASVVTFENMTLGGVASTTSDDYKLTSYVANGGFKFIGDCDVSTRQLRLRYNCSLAFENGFTDMGATYGWSCAYYLTAISMNFDNARFRGFSSSSLTTRTLTIAMTLGENNAGTNPVIDFAGTFAVGTGSTLAIDATAMAAGTYTIIKAEEFSDLASFATKATVTCASGMTATLAADATTLKLTIASGSGDLPTVDGKTVEPGAVFDSARTTKPITYPSAPTVKGDVGNQSIEYGNSKTSVPKYYTATASGNTVTLTLNDFARPTIEDESSTPAIVIEGGKVKIHAKSDYAGTLYFALGSADTPDAADSKWTIGAYQTSCDFSNTPTESKKFYKVFVNDVK